MSDPYIIAIDFGTAFSGYAYSVTPTNEEIKPQVKLWKQKGGWDTSKTMTCILFDENEKFLHFGSEAKEKYYEMHEDSTKYYFFKDFKMELYGKRVNKDLVIRAENKKTMNALKVFSEALRFLKEDALETIKHNAVDPVELEAADFTWVLTVPAIWDIPARQFMREAAVQAGIVSSSTEDKLVIALEPEAASVWCKQLPSEGFIVDNNKKVDLMLYPGSQYIVVDGGGGTIDITVHEVLEGGALKELHKASGNDKGGRTVDKKFIKCLRDFFCDGLWIDYEKRHPKEAQKFMEDFIYFRQADHYYTRQLDLYNEFKSLIEERKNKEGMGESSLFKTMEGINWDSGKIIISKQKMESFFHESLVHITDSLYEILKKHKGIEYILFVGGLSSSYILREHVRKEFGHMAKVVCPKRPQEAIVKGAVLFGRDQSIIRSRKSAFTYGLAISKTFDFSIHKPEKMSINKEGMWCKDLFSKLVEIDEDVGWDETRNYSFYPVERDQNAMNLRFYRTERKNATYVDDWGMEGPVASCLIDMPDITKGMKRQVKLEVSFGSTEITAKATDLESKSTVSVKIDFITK